MLHREIPLEIAPNELLVRGIITPLFYSQSKNVLKREAFLPPPDKQDVSLLRRFYSDDNFCKNHAAALVVNQQEYCGLATFYSHHVADLNKLFVQDVRAEIRASPIDNAGNYVTDKRVFQNDSGLPMHADLIYPSPIKKGEVQTKYREYASKLVKIANYFKDPNPKIAGWEGDILSWNDKTVAAK